MLGRYANRVLCGLFDPMAPLGSLISNLGLDVDQRLHFGADLYCDHAGRCTYVKSTRNSS